MLIVSLKGAVFNAPIGLYPQEIPLHNDIEIDIEVAITALPDALPLIDYEVLYNIAKASVKEHTPLLEDVVKRILNEVEVLHPTAQIDVSVRKLNPPLGTKVKHCEVRFVKKAG